MTAPPLISVAMPVYNAERYLAEAVESILGQTFTDFEFLIVDDGSTDNSRAILERYAKLDDRIRLVSRPNTGYLIALNEMLERARGELIARMDADDVALPRRFERQVRYLEEHPECVLVGSRVIVIDPDGRALTEMTDMLSHEQIDRGLMAGIGAAVYHPSVIYRKEVVRSIGAYRNEYYLCEDLDLFLRLAEVGRIVNLSEPLLKYREHLAKVGRSRVEQQDLTTRKALEEAHRRRGLPFPESLSGPSGRLQSPGEIYRNWSWWALGAGHVSTARKHAVASLTHNPFSSSSWKLLLCAIRGR